MLVPIAIAMLAQVAGAAPVIPAPTANGQTTSGGEVKTANRCPILPANAQPGEIVVCAKRPEGFRLDPDVMEAKREMRSGGRPKRPDRMRDTSCAVVGPAGCMGANPGINLLGAALTAAEMAARLAKGQEIGSLFITDPTPSEYQLYVEAKQRREAKEAEAAAIAKAKSKAADSVKAANSRASATEPGP
jgi:hypothetical protein